MIKKRFHIKDNSGLYLSDIPPIEIDYDNYIELLLKDIDFFPSKSNDASNIFKNCSLKTIDNVNHIYGNNKKPKSDNAVLFSEFTKKNSLVYSKLGYINTFDFYFKFHGSNNITGNLNTLKVKLYIQIGSNVFPLTLTNLSIWDYDINTDTYYYIPVNAHPTKDFYFNGVSSGISIANNNIWNSFEGEYSVSSGNSIVMGYDDNDDMFEDYLDAPNQLNFKISCQSPINIKLENNRDYKIIIEYLDIETNEPKLSETIVEYVPLQLEVLEPPQAIE